MVLKIIKIFFEYFIKKIHFLLVLLLQESDGHALLRFKDVFDLV